MDVLKVKIGDNWIGIPAIKGETGNGIASITFNDDYTLTITYTNGQSMTTDPIRGAKGDPGDPVDVQINGTSIVEDGVANVPLATENTAGAMILGTGFAVDSGSNKTYINFGTSTTIKNGDSASRPVPISRQHESVFYGLAKAAGADMAQSSNPVGTFTEEAKRAICAMIGVRYNAPFKLIRNYTVPQDDEPLRINITVDEDGSPFTLTELIVDMSIKQAASTGNGGIIINDVIPDNDKPYLGIYNIFSSSGNQRRIAHLIIDGGRLFGECFDTNAASAWTPATKRSSPNASGIIEVASITSIGFTSLNGYVVPGGSSIKIYGR